MVVCSFNFSFIVLFCVLGGYFGSCWVMFSDVDWFICYVCDWFSYVLCWVILVFSVYLCFNGGGFSGFCFGCGGVYGGRVFFVSVW